MLLVIGCLGLVWKMVQYAPPTVAAAPVKSTPVRLKAKR
jgi:hypothetical protein